MRAVREADKSCKGPTTAPLRGLVKQSFYGDGLNQVTVIM